MTKGENKALMRAWKEKQNKPYILKKANVKSLFNYLRKCLDKEPCNHTLIHTIEWLKKKYVDNNAIIDRVLDEIREDGGYCDCEVLLNCYERYELE